MDLGPSLAGVFVGFLGSIPGIILGSLATGRINDNLVRYALVAMLFVSAAKMIAG